MGKSREHLEDSGYSAPTVCAPTLSVVICNFNHGRYLPRALDAIFAQSRQPDEVVIVDDGSTDNSVEVIERYRSSHPTVIFLRNSKNIGLLATWQRAEDATTGDYIYWGAADDYVLPGFFANAMRAAVLHPQAGAIAGECVLADPEGNETTVVRGPGWTHLSYVSPDRFLAEYLRPESSPNASFASAVVHKRASLHQVGGMRPELGFYADTFAFRAEGLRFGICYLAERSALWHAMPGGFALGSRRDVGKELRILTASTNLMRSEEFRADFPSDYVAEWAASYRSGIIERATGRVAACAYELEISLLPDLPARPVYERAATWGLLRVVRLCRALLKGLLVRSLRRDGGDSPRRS